MDWLRLIPSIGGLVAILYVTVQHFRGGTCEEGKGQVNPSIQKDTTEKVVHSFDIEDLGNKQEFWFCRCWKSKTFPYCDGAHFQHNKETGDNVGPLCLTKKSASS